MKRRETNLPCEIEEPAGHAIKRNPGAICIWTTKSYRAFTPPGGVLFSLGKPESVEWLAEGRAATREEVLQSIEAGYGELEKLAQLDGEGAVSQLAEARRHLEESYLPKSETWKNYSL